MERFAKVGENQMTEAIVKDFSEKMLENMKADCIVVGGGPSGRFWHTDAGFPLPDALTTLSLLLAILSRSDRPLSEVLDGEPVPAYNGGRASRGLRAQHRSDGDI